MQVNTFRSFVGTATRIQNYWHYNGRSRQHAVYNMALRSHQIVDKYPLNGLFFLCLSNLCSCVSALV